MLATLVDKPFDNAEWQYEVKKGLKMSDFTIYNAIDRIKNEGDIFKPVPGKGINLGKIIKQFNNQ